MTFHAFKRVRMVYDLCSLYSTLRTFQIQPSDFPLTKTLSLPNHRFAKDLSRSNFNANDVIDSRTFSTIDLVCRYLRVIEDLNAESGGILALYALRFVFSGSRSSSEDIIPSFTRESNGYFDSQSGHVKATLDGDVLRALLVRLDVDGIFPLSTLIQAELCVCNSLLEYVVAVLSCLPIFIVEKAHEKVKLLRENPDIDIEILLFCLETVLKGTSITSGNVGITNDCGVSFEGLYIRNVVFSLGYLCDIVISFLDKAIILKELRSIRQFELMSMKESHEMLQTMDMSNNDLTVVFPLIGMKLKHLVALLYKVKENNGGMNSEEAFRTIVFCRTRLTALALNDFLVAYASFDEKQSKPNEGVASIQTETTQTISFGSKILSETVESTASVCIVGSASNYQQSTSLQQFRIGESTILVATNTCEEGIDVQTCNIVVNYDPPQSFAAFIQRRGRARAKNSSVISILDYSEFGQKTAEFLHNCELEEKDQLKSSIALSEASKADANEDVETNSDETIFEIPSTGARVNLYRAKQLLMEYCQYMYRDHSYSNWRPLFEPATDEAEGLYRCSILLPPKVSPAIRCSVSGLHKTKGRAEGVAAIECIRKLYYNGDMNDRFEPTIKKVKRRIEMPKKSSKNAEDTIAKMSIKTVPDSLCPMKSPEMARNYPLTLFFYQFLAVSRDQRDEVYSHCKECVLPICLYCKQAAEVIHDVGLAFLSPLPSDISHYSDEELFEVFRSSAGSITSASWPFLSHCLGNMSLSLKYLGKRHVFEDEWRDLNRFHRALCCWSNSVSEDQNILSLETLRAVNHQTTSKQPFDADLWSQSGNGAWFCVFPSCLSETFSQERLWRQHLSICTDEAELLAHNLWIQEKLKYNTIDKHLSEGSVYLNSIESFDDRVGYLVSRSRDRLVVTIDRQMDVSINSNHQTMGLVVSSQLNYFHILGCHPSLVTNDINKHLLDHDNDRLVSCKNEEYLILGKAKWFYYGFAVPSMVWRIQSSLLAIESRSYLHSFIHLKDPFFDTLQPLPKVSDMLTAITPCRAEEEVQFERFEFLGDAFLKFIVTLVLYRMFPTKNEGQLHDIRTRHITNDFLAARSHATNVIQYLRGQTMDTGKKSMRICPPGILHQDKCLWNRRVVNKDTMTQQMIVTRNDRSDHPLGSRYDHTKRLELIQNDELPWQYMQITNVNKKEPADLIEAVIGVYFHSYGVQTAMKLVDGLGILPQIDGIEDQSISSHVIALNETRRSSSMATANIKQLSHKRKLDCLSIEESSSNNPQEPQESHGIAEEKLFELSLRVQENQIPHHFSEYLRRIALGLNEPAKSARDDQMNDDPEPVLDDIPVDSVTVEDKTVLQASDSSPVKTSTERAVAMQIDSSMEIQMATESLTAVQTMSDQSVVIKMPLDSSTAIRTSIGQAAAIQMTPESLAIVQTASDQSSAMSMTTDSIISSQTIAATPQNVIKRKENVYRLRNMSFKKQELISSLLNELEAQIGYEFRDITTLRQVFVHTSSGEQRNITNERLEFLGDAVLDLAVVQLLFNQSRDGQQAYASPLPNDKSKSKFKPLNELDEGLLTSRKMQAINNYRLCIASLLLGLDKILLAMMSPGSQLRDDIYKLSIKISQTMDLMNQMTPSTGNLMNENDTLDSQDNQPRNLAKLDLIGSDEEVKDASNLSGQDKSYKAIGAKANSPNDRIVKHLRCVKRVLNRDDNLVKPLADLFEALIGAIFLDSHENFEPIYRIVLAADLLFDEHDPSLVIDAMEQETEEIIEPIDENVADDEWS